MKHTTTLLAVLAFVSASLLSCDEYTPTIEKAVDQWYTAGCVLVYNSTELTQAEAISTWHDLAAMAGCDNQFDDVLRCMLDQESSTTCATACDTEFTLFNACQFP